MAKPPFPTIQQIGTKNLTWVNISKSGKEEIKYLADTFHFHHLHLDDCISTTQRPKLDVAREYLFMVLLFPIYNRKTRQISSAEVDFFINQNCIVMVQNNQLPPLINFFNLCQISQSQRKKYFQDNPAALLYEILNRLLLYCSPIIELLDANINGIEENIFRGYERRMVREILVVKRNIVNFRRIMKVHETIIRKLIAKSTEFFSPGQLKLYFNELAEMTGDIWNALENLYETIGAIEQTNNSLISFRLNDIMKVLALISVTVLPISLIADIAGMNIKGMPFSDIPYIFWYVLGFMGCISFSMIYFFKRRGWM